MSKELKKILKEMRKIKKLVKEYKCNKKAVKKSKNQGKARISFTEKLKNRKSDHNDAFIGHDVKPRESL